MLRPKRAWRGLAPRGMKGSMSPRRFSWERGHPPPPPCGGRLARLNNRGPSAGCSFVASGQGGQDARAPRAHTRKRTFTANHRRMARDPGMCPGHWSWFSRERQPKLEGAGRQLSTDRRHDSLPR